MDIFIARHILEHAFDIPRFIEKSKQMSQQKILIPQSLLNFKIPESKIKIEARSLQNFVAAIGDANDIYYNDALPEGISSHPCYPVTTTWPLFEQMMPSLIQAGLSPHALNKLVHRGPLGPRFQSIEPYH